MNKILYIGDFMFPEGEAYSTRALYFCRIFRELGIDVFVVGHGDNREKDATSNGFEYSEIQYSNIKSHSRNLKNRVFNYFNKSKEIDIIIKNLYQQQKFDAIFVGASFRKYMNPISSLTRQYNIPIIIDAVEWFDPSNLPLGIFGPFYWDVNKSIKSDFVKAGNIICISSFFEDYYKNKGCNTIRVPTITDSSDEKWIDKTENSNEKLIIAYFGSPGKKDYISNVIVGFALNKEHLDKIELRIYGPSKEQVNSLLGAKSYVLDKLGTSIKIYGRLSYENVINEIHKVDFTVLLRPNKRYANAGFPTKFAESLMAGVPVLTNLTSDLNLYVKDGFEGIIVKDCTPKAFSNALDKALTYNKIKLNEMKQYSRQTAVNSFDYRIYIPIVKDFFAQLK